ncbi:MAG: hypothetical protein E7773_14000 [Sphingomonas sp.]|uniref:DUF6445 family protein n=1 Tax=Sphingomonas sp. TaxID=28214 RepID=UPI0012183906|nr:DUF6445 family protein [Sphingomonas sp.]THD34771.1 MAG: hypothetical protein E7773_14000 [Sphingomonas sp.]
MPLSMMVVDDFLEEPGAFRDTALRLTYPDQQGLFPGRNSLERLKLDGLTEEVSRLTGERLIPLDPPQSHSKCRITLAADVGRGRVHIDPGYWSGILYLSRPEDCRGGTDFFRHKPTGTDRAPVSSAELAALGYASFDEMRHGLVEKDSMDDGKWELTSTVPMRFNRLVLLRPWLWHTAGPGFGDRLENGRLIYVMFFQPAR